ncbi:hypothetical protein GEV43_26735 [Actinomadura sp. J1-007]|nr:hypothetical protein [Actinomadura sp. J1-007]
MGKRAVNGRRPRGRRLPPLGCRPRGHRLRCRRPTGLRAPRRIRRSRCGRRTALHSAGPACTG